MPTLEHVDSQHNKPMVAAAFIVTANCRFSNSQAVSNNLSAILLFAILTRGAKGLVFKPPADAIAVGTVPIVALADELAVDVAFADEPLVFHRALFSSTEG